MTMWNFKRLQKRHVGWAAAGAAAVAALAWAFAPRAVPVETAVVERGRFEQSIEEDGRTRLRDRFTISAPATARLARITLREGDRVKAGDTVAVLTPVMPAMIDERSLREAGARLKAAEAGVAAAQARADRARVAQERAQAAALLQPAGAAPGRPLVVRSPVAGVVLRVPLQSEGTVAAGTALIDVGDPARMEVVAELLTTDAVRVAPGTRAVIERWGGPPVQARVRLVEPAARTKVSALGIEEQRVNVLLDVASPPPGWLGMGDGFRVTVRLITASADDAVIVPVGALFPFADGGMAVFRLDGGRARVQPVELAGRNGTAGWVRGGVQPGQSVIVYPPPAVADGSRVAVRKP